MTETGYEEQDLSYNVGNNDDIIDEADDDDPDDLEEERELKVLNLMKMFTLFTVYITITLLPKSISLINVHFRWCPRKPAQIQMKIR